jgi:hypothetical protein
VRRSRRNESAAKTTASVARIERAVTCSVVTAPAG